MLTTIETGFEGLLLIKPNVFQDKRGHFVETFNQGEMAKIGIDVEFRQDNQSLSSSGIVRGLHFQKPPHAQAKLVRVVRGKVRDVVVDIRKGSPTYGKHFGAELSGENFLMMYIPTGFAHGFVTLTDDTLFLYKCSDTYHPETEGGLLWNDPALGIDWGINDPILSEKDTKYSILSELETPFTY